MTVQNAPIDENEVRGLTAANPSDGTPVKIYGDPTTHRLYVTMVGGGVTELAATGTVNGVNTQFTFIQQPTYIVSDGLWYKPLDNNGATNWSWSSGTLTATMTIPPSSSIFGIA